MIQLLLILPWLGAGALAYWKMETNGSRLKKHDATLYDKIKDDKDGSEKKKIKDELENKKKLLNSSKEKLEKLKKDIKEGNEEDSETNKEQVKKLEEVITKQESETQAMEAADKKLWLPVLSVNNILWVLGLFFGVGLIGHFITKKILSIFKDDK